MVHGFFISSCILISSIIMMILAFKMITCITSSFNLTNSLYFFMIFYIFYAYIGSVIFNVWYTPACEGYRLYERKDILIKVWVIVSFGLFAIPLFTSVFYRALSFNSKKAINELRKKNYLGTSQKKSFFYCFFLILFFICLGVFALYVKKIGGVPLILFIKDRSLSVALLRSNATNNFSGKMWRYELFFKHIPIVLLICLYLFKKKNLLYKCVFCFLFFTSIMNFQKGPLIRLFLIILIAFQYKTKKISFKTLVLVAILSLVSLILMYTFFMGSKNIKVALLGMMQRVLTGQITPFNWYFRYIEKNGYLLGNSFPNPGNIFPFQHVRITVEVMNLYYSRINRITDVVGSMPTVFMAEWYANFGYVGILISLIIFAFFLSLIDIFLIQYLKRKNSVYMSSCYIYLIYYFSIYSGTSFTGILFDTALIIPTFLFIIFNIISNSKISLAFKYIPQRSSC